MVAASDRFLQHRICPTLSSIPSSRTVHDCSNTSTADSTITMESLDASPASVTYVLPYLSLQSSSAWRGFCIGTSVQHNEISIPSAPVANAFAGTLLWGVECKIVERRRIQDYNLCLHCRCGLMGVHRSICFFFSSTLQNPHLRNPP
jgi:hypothetical protein